MDAVHTIAKGSVTYALFFAKSLKAPDGVRFLTKEDMPLQVGLMERTKGYVVQPHAHPVSDRHIRSTPEFLYIESGMLRIKVFDEEWVLLEEREVGAGDFVLLLAGGHSVEIINDARFIEVKQGPYVGTDQDKVSPPVL